MHTHIIHVTRNGRPIETRTMLDYVEDLVPTPFDYVDDANTDDAVAALMRQYADVLTPDDNPRELVVHDLSSWRAKCLEGAKDLAKQVLDELDTAMALGHDGKLSRRSQLNELDWAMSKLRRHLGSSSDIWIDDEFLGSPCCSRPLTEWLLHNAEEGMHILVVNAFDAHV